jgi:hypothetical protein
VNWAELPPRDPEDCCFREQVEATAVGESARCGLVRMALPEADDRFYQAFRAACSACCRAAPAAPTAWNPVVASLIYQAASALIRAPGARPEAVARAQAARVRALACLDADGPAAEEKLQRTASIGALRERIPPPARGRRARIRRWAVGVTTAPRPRPTLNACLQSLARAGWERPHLFMDSAVRVGGEFGRLPGTLRSPAAGAWPNHYLALFELSMRQPDADAYLIVQDDALIYDRENVREYLEEALWPAGRPGVVSLYCPAPYTAKRAGWRRYRKSWVWGALALVFPRITLQRYLRDRSIAEHRWRSKDEGLAQIDALLGWWALQRRIAFWHPTPSLVQHIGQISTLWADNPAAGPRAARLFLGDDPAGAADREPPEE